MERIKQALERARKQRDVVDSAPTSSDRIVTAPPSAVQSVAYTNTRVVPSAPGLLRKNKIIANCVDETTITAYNMLRTQVLQRLSEHGWNSLAIISANHGEGRTLTAINLAISMAREVDKTVLLVDLDLRRPGIANYFGFTPEYGVVDYMLNDIPLKEMLFNPGIERLVVLPGNCAVSNSAELLSSKKMLQLVDELKQRYPSRIVIFDLPPLLSAADALAFAPHVEAALLVIADGQTTKSDITDTLAMLEITNVVGTVLNRKMA